MGPCWSALLQHNLLNSSQDPDGIFLPGFEARHDPIGNPMPEGTFHQGILLAFNPLQQLGLFALQVRGWRGL